MFKIQNLSGGSLSLMLETNCIILTAGAYYDLDGICSRAWIHTDQNLQRLLKHKHIRVVHDSESHIAKMPISKNEKVFALLQAKEKQNLTVPANTYSPKEYVAQPPNLPKPEYPHRRNVNTLTEKNRRKILSQFPALPVDDPIIVDLSRYLDLNPAPAPAAPPVQKPAVVEEPVIEALPVVKVDPADLKELFKEYPELKKPRRGRKKKVKVVEEPTADGQNQSN